MSAPTPTIIVVGNLQMAWRLCGDRWAHEIAVQQGDVAVTVLASFEGKPDDLWPSSPPLQEMRIEDRGDNRRVALLVGMAGASHWSMSVEADMDTGSLRYDVACRVRHAPQWLGSTYRVMTPAHLQVSRLVCTTSSGRCELSGDHAMELRRDSSPCPSGVRLLTIRASEAGAVMPQTIRWQYEIRVSR